VSDIRYVVTTVYQVDDQASAKAGKIGSAFEGLGSFADGAAAAMDSVAGKLFAVGAAMAALATAGAVGALKVGLVDVNSKLEDVEIGFATIFNMLGASGSFEQGLSMGKELMSQIRLDAASLPGEFADFVAMAQTITAPLVNAGKGMEDIRNLTRDSVVAAAALGVNYDQAAREMAQLLEGHAGGHNVLGTRLGITTSTQVNGKDFNKATSAERFDFIEKSLSKAKESLPAFQKSWSGLTSTMIDDGKRLLGAATQPLFERLKTTFAGINTMLESGTAMSYAERVGAWLGHAFDVVKAKAADVELYWYRIQNASMKFADELRGAFEKVWPIVEKIGSYLGDKLQDPGKFLGELAGARVGLAVAGAAPGALGGLGGGAGAAAGLEAAAAAAAPLAVLLVAAAGAVDVLTRSADTGAIVLDALAEAGQEVARDIQANFSAAIGETSEALHTIWQESRPLVDLLGVALLGAVDGAIYAFRNIVGSLTMFADGLMWILDQIPGAKAALGISDTSGVASAALGKSDKVKEAERNAFFAKEQASHDAQVNAAAMTAAKVAMKMPGAGKVNVQVNAPLTVLSDSDPERLAKAVATHVDEKMRNALTSRSLTAFRAF